MLCSSRHGSLYHPEHNAILSRDCCLPVEQEMQVLCNTLCCYLVPLQSTVVQWQLATHCVQAASTGDILTAATTASLAWFELQIKCVLWRAPVVGSPQHDLFPLSPTLGRFEVQMVCFCRQPRHLLFLHVSSKLSCTPSTLQQQLQKCLLTGAASWPCTPKHNPHQSSSTASQQGSSHQLTTAYSRLRGKQPPRQ